MKPNNGKAFAFKSSSIFVADPADIGIIGGKSILHGHERGDLDTVSDPEHPLADDTRLAIPLTEEFINSIDARGVLEPISVTKIGECAMVVFGRRRLRAARVVNARRAKRGEPPLSIRCENRRETGTSLLGIMLTENAQRTNDTLAANIESLKRLISRGVSIEDCAITLDEPVTVLKGWLLFDENATPATKKAAAAERLSASAAAEVARIKDPAAQDARLEKLLSSPGKKVTVKAVRAARDGKSEIPSRKELRDGLARLGSTIPGVTSTWAEVSEELLAFILDGKRSATVNKVWPK